VNACAHTYTKPQTSSTRSRGLGWRIHGSVEDTKLSTNKQHSLSRPAHAPLNGRPSALEVIAPASLSYMFTCTDVARPRLRRPLMLFRRPQWQTTTCGCPSALECRRVAPDFRQAHPTKRRRGPRSLNFGVCARCQTACSTFSTCRFHRSLPHRADPCYHL
jgi:hypothetical protein